MVGNDRRDRASRQRNSQRPRWVHRCGNRALQTPLRRPRRSPTLTLPACRAFTWCFFVRQAEVRASRSPKWRLAAANARRLHRREGPCVGMRTAAVAFFAIARSGMDVLGFQNAENARGNGVKGSDAFWGASSASGLPPGLCRSVPCRWSACAAFGWSTRALEVVFLTRRFYDKSVALSCSMSYLYVLVLVVIQNNNTYDTTLISYRCRLPRPQAVGLLPLVSLRVLPVLPQLQSQP